MLLKCFTNSNLICHLDRPVLVRFLEDFQDCLTPEAKVLITGNLEYEQFCAACVTHFSSPEAFGAPLLQALIEIDTLARPENRQLLQDALDHSPPNWISLTKPSLHQSLHLWLLARNTPGFAFPIVAAPVAPAIPNAPPPPIENSRCPPSSNANPASDVRAPAIDARDSGPAPAVENQKSEIENSFARLARLSSVEYDLVRRAEAKRLNLRLRTFDDAVERARILEDDAQANALKLPQLEPWPEPITDAPALFDDVHDRCLLYLHLPPGAAVVLTLWSAHAHAIKAFTLSPRLNFTSTEPGCGKTTALDFLATLTPNVLRTDNLKTAVLFRVVEQQQPTLLLDELDSYLHLFPELRGLINSGHSDSGYVHRCEGNVVRAFKSFAATALAGIGDLANTLRDRSIIIALSKAPPGVLKARFDKRRVETETTLGRKMARWVQDNFAAIAACDPVMPPAAHNRLGDNWRPLFAIAQLVGAHWPQQVLDAFTALAARCNSTTPFVPETKTPDRQLLLTLLDDIRAIFAVRSVDRLFSSSLVRALQALPNRPWSAMSNKPLTETRLARHLSTLGIHSQTIRIQAERARGYRLYAFIDPPSPTSPPGDSAYQI